MPISKNRRAEAYSRGLLTRTEALVARASFHLFNDDPLAATRLLRAAEGLNALDDRLRSKRARERGEFATHRAVQERARDCERREILAAYAEAQLSERRAQLEQSEAALAVAYKLMREGKLDGPPPATGEETDSGVAPI